MKKGDYIRKNNYGLFPNGVPVMQIKTVEFTSKKYLMINGVIFTGEPPVLLSKEERFNLITEWNAFGFTPVLSDSQPFQCVREDNGQPKVAIPLERLKEILWTYIKRFPEKTFEAYQCPTCKQYHIGKPRTAETK